MIPILYNKGETEFESNGVGRLADTISCIIEEEKNGIYELTLTYPITGALFNDLIPGAYLKAVNGNASNKQLFTVYKISKPLNGIVTVNAQHISYALSKTVASPFTADNVVSALEGMSEKSSTNCPFTFWTDKITDGEFVIDIPSSIRSKLGGSEGSILDIYGGEYEFDNYTVRLWNKRGQNRGVVLRYGKNITDINQEENIQNTITGVYPYWKNNEAYYELPDKVVLSKNASCFPEPLIIPLDCSSKFETQPTEQQLTEYAAEYLSNNNAGVPEVNISVSFVNLAETEEYKDIAQLEEVELCDDVTVYFEKLNISAVAEVVKTTYNVLKEQYDSIQVGEVKANLASNIAVQSAQLKEKPSRNFMENAIKNATNLITGVDGGAVVLHQDGNGKPYELLIMDTDDIQTAKNVWRYNKNGWGRSKNGYNGPYTLAATLDGGFVADFITAGTMLANRIKGGTLTLGGINNGNGVATVLDANGNVITRMNSSGIEIYGGSISIGSNFGVFSNGYMRALEGKIGPWSLHENGFTSEDYNAQFHKQADGTWTLYLPNGSGWFCDLSVTDGITVKNLNTTGEKKRIVETKSYNVRSLYCYEMPSPIFGDIGHGVIGEDGLCYIDIDQVFLETVDTEQNYHVFLQPYSENQVHVAKKEQGYFIVKGTPDTEFAWEIKAKQLDFPLERLEEKLAEDDYKETDYIALANAYLNEYEQEVLNHE